MKKRIIALLLALLMVLGMTATAFADGNISVASILPDQPTHTYIFNADGREFAKQIVRSGETLNDPGTPAAPTGQRFAGWDPQVSFVTPIEVKETQKITVNAKFETVYTVYFKHGKKIVATKELTDTTSSVTTDDVLVSLNADERLAGWYIGETPYTEVTTNDFAQGTYTLTLMAKVEDGNWLRFDSAGGSYVEPQFVTDRTSAPTPPPTKPGYTFAGWYVGNEMFEFGKELGESITLTAHWTAADSTKYTVIHWWENADDTGYSFHESQELQGKTGATTAATAKSYEGFTVQPITQQEIKGDGSTIVNVYYTRTSYDVKFYEFELGFPSGSWNVIYLINAKHGANISKQWPGGTWSTTTSGGPYQANINTMPLGGASFYKKTIQGNEEAYYYLENLNGDYVLDHTDTGGGILLTYQVTDEDRYPITGFTCNTAMSAKNGDNYNGAKFYYNRNQYQIKFISDAQVVHTESKKYQESLDGVVYKLNDKEQYTFAGWYDNEKCEGAEYVFKEKTMPANDVTLYAKWVAKTYTVTVYDADKLTELYKFENVAMGSTIKESEMPKPPLGEGETLLGWVNVQNDMPFNFGTEIYQDYALYPMVGDASEYTVTYELGEADGTAPVDTNHYAKDAQAVVLPFPVEATPPTGMIFLHWTAGENDSTHYYPGGKLTVTGDMTLTAKYGAAAETVKVTYHSNFGSDTTVVIKDLLNNSTFTVAAYTALKLPENPNHTFVGWNTKADGSGTTYQPGEQAIVNTDPGNDLYAQWKQNTPKPVVFDPNFIYGEPLAAKSLWVRSGTAPLETFEVVIKALEGQEYSSGAVTMRGGSQARAFTGFEEITFTEPGTYRFTVGEVDNNTRYMSYDPNLYILTVEVEEQDEKLEISDVYYTNSTIQTAEGDGSFYIVDVDGLYNYNYNVVKYRKFPIVFENIYDGKTTYVIPDTPDKLNAVDHYAYVIGYPDGGVHPNDTITRAETATIFFRLLTDKVRDKNYSKSNSFTDVPRDAWYNAAISTMEKLDIITGYPDGTFRPDAPVTRAEFAAIAARFDEKTARATASFQDIYGHWAMRYISRSAELGWIRGYTDNTFRPDQNITRAEAMALINRVLNRNPETKEDLLRSMNIFNDNLDTGKWYYLDVQEAANSHDYTRKSNGCETWLRLIPDPNWKALER